MTSRKPAPNYVLVGGKSPTDYAAAILTLLHRGHKSVVVKARGNRIARAVDVVNHAKKCFQPKLQWEVKIGSEEYGEGRISAIWIDVWVGE